MEFLSKRNAPVRRGDGGRSGGSARAAAATRMMCLSGSKYEEDIRLLHEIAATLIAERRRDGHAAVRKDLLALMLATP